MTMISSWWSAPATTGNLLEIGILDRDADDPVVIHAMNLRPKFQR